ncbi:hypothetical protein A6A08_02140 [Nocardiopsis sp. TSRI0078]|uniref:hypothetical protein n=1 Tax=unclassified Nocardiopsis TaxID=2649073 RepID=UPI000939EE2D|nr:hypothetical protein [Nocardiopsis sp. TSRI0078]OKI23595.1 hypothetical protein A6A08_02140 [Nocardiopsis sp. TSRI0078]
MGHSARSPSPEDITRPARQGNTELTRALSAYLGIKLTPREFTLADGTRIGVDCADGSRPTVLAQFSPLHGPVKSAQRNKVIADAFKLVWLRDRHFPDARVLLVLGEPLAKLFGRGAWLPAAFATHRITVVIADDEHRIRTLDISM